MIAYEYSPSPTPAGAQSWQWKAAYGDLRILFWRYGTLRLDWTLHTPRWRWITHGSLEIPVRQLLRWRP